MVIELEGVRKSYRRLRGGGPTVAVDDLTIAVPRGGVHGFLGPNGSGKTTTIRIVMGLVAPDSGTIRVLGAQMPRGLPSVVGRLGALVESPQMFPDLLRPAQPADPGHARPTCPGPASTRCSSWWGSPSAPTTG